MSLTATLKASINWLRQTALDLSTVQDSSKLEFEKTLADGTGNDQADLLWHDERTVGTGANDDLDLTALTQSIFGSTVTTVFAKVKAILIKNMNTAAGDELVIDTSVANAFKGWSAASATSKAEIGPGGAFQISAPLAGWTVTNGSNDVIRVSNPAGGTTITYRIVICGTSV